MVKLFAMGNHNHMGINGIKNFIKDFPEAKTLNLRNDISSYTQLELNTLYDTWETFKELLRRRPMSRIPFYMQVQIFYNGLNNHQAK